MKYKEKYHSHQRKLTESGAKKVTLHPYIVYFFKKNSKSL